MPPSDVIPRWFCPECETGKVRCHVCGGRATGIHDPTFTKCILPVCGRFYHKRYGPRTVASRLGCFHRLVVCESACGPFCRFPCGSVARSLVWTASLSVAWCMFRSVRRRVLSILRAIARSVLWFTFRLWLSVYRCSESWVGALVPTCVFCCDSSAVHFLLACLPGCPPADPTTRL